MLALLQALFRLYKIRKRDGTFVKIEAMTKANGYASNSGNIDDLARFGFNEVDLNYSNKF